MLGVNKLIEWDVDSSTYCSRRDHDYRSHRRESPPGVIGLSPLGGVGLSASNEARLKVCMDKQRAKEGKGNRFCRSVRFEY
jgi:hypothetical protein